SAWPVFAEGDGPVLEVTDAGGAAFVIPAEAGRQVALQEPKVTVRVLSPMSGAMSGPGAPYASVITVEIENEQGAKEFRLVATSDGADDDSPGAVRLRYLWPRPIGARSDPASGAPAMDVMLFRNGRQMRQWLIAGTGGPHAWLSLQPLAGPQEAERRGAADGAPVLCLVRPRREVRDYKSDVAVLEDGKTVAGKVIEVNQPLHYGGYYFYQHSYDRQNERYTVLMATSDSGLRLVYVGFGLLWVGVVWWCWAVPAWRSLARRGGERGA
ncbi:MAG: cytochrome c biogenesis protein ResB, partial [Candidatus Brocadiae bacterium]|nr:cytochrome c biogenesis protein ResB [Candidatus Brocadiia bacterium]